MDGNMKKGEKLGPVKVSKDPWLWKQLFRHEILKQLEGQSPKEVPGEVITAAKTLTGAAKHARALKTLWTRCYAGW